MADIPLGTLKDGIEPAALAGAAITVTADGSSFSLVSTAGSQAVTRDILRQLDERQVVAWASDQHRQVALGIVAPPAHPAPAAQPAGSLIPDYNSPMLNQPPEFTAVPDARDGHGLLWRAAVYVAAVTVVPTGVFFAYAMLADPALSASESLAAFGVSGFLLSALAGLAVGYAVDTLAKKL